MLDVNAIVDADLDGLSPEAITVLAMQMQRQLKAQQLAIEQQAHTIERKNAELRLKTAKLEKVNFELARLKAWKFGAKSEAMSAEQRRLFEETLSEDEASLLAQLEQLQGQEEGQDVERPPPAQAPGSARALAPRRAPPRTRRHRLPGARLRPADGAHRRGHQREAGHDHQRRAVYLEDVWV